MKNGTRPPPGVGLPDYCNCHYQNHARDRKGLEVGTEETPHLLMASHIKRKDDASPPPASSASRENHHEENTCFRMMAGTGSCQRRLCSSRVSTIRREPLPLTPIVEARTVSEFPPSGRAGTTREEDQIKRNSSSTAKKSVHAQTQTPRHRGSGFVPSGQEPNRRFHDTRRDYVDHVFNQSQDRRFFSGIALDRDEQHAPA
jgi:hypothetical protein